MLQLLLEKNKRSIFFTFTPCYDLTKLKKKQIVGPMFQITLLDIFYVHFAGKSKSVLAYAVSELKSVPTPPRGVVDTMSAVMGLLGHSRAEADR